MFSWFLFREIFKALAVITCRFVYAHVTTFIMILLAVFLLFEHSVTFRRTFWFFYQQVVAAVIVSAWCTLILPVLCLRQRKFDNAVTLSLIAKPLMRIIGIECEIRNRENGPAEDESAVIVSNHPSGLDILSMMYVVTETRQPGTMIISHNLSWFGPFGWVLKQCGLIFVKKTPGLQSTYEEINKVADAAHKEKMKIWIFPEGRTSEKLLPFKKGAFRIAVDRKMPIIPVVFSPHKFVDWKRLQAKKGKIIIDCLPRISTTEYSHENMNTLIAKTHAAIARRYEELGGKIKQKTRVISG